MPELPEVENIVRELRIRVIGKTIEDVRVYLKKMARPGPIKFSRMVKGNRIREVERLGKYIILVLDRNQKPDPTYVVIHLKMTGQLLYRPKSQDRPDYVHVKFSFKGKGELLYKDIRQFGFLHRMEQTEYHRWKTEQDLGPDPYELKPKDFVARLRARKGRIKPLLLNQRFIRGLGNIYVDESLFAAGIHPLTHAIDISEEKCLRLHREMINILTLAIHYKGSTISNFQAPNGQKGKFQDMHRVYRHHGEKCSECENIIQRIVVAGRGTHFCPKCQPASLV